MSADARTTPDRLTTLAPGEVFVFGANGKGRHLRGAAALARRKFGARWGKADGHHGNSYAIDTMSGFDTMAAAVERFLAYAAEQSTQTFLVTEIGCGIAGYTPAEVAPLFKMSPANVVLPRRFSQELQGGRGAL